jgi:hypothetical protein
VDSSPNLHDIKALSKAEWPQTAAAPPAKKSADHFTHFAEESNTNHLKSRDEKDKNDSQNDNEKLSFGTRMGACGIALPKMIGFCFWTRAGGDTIARWVSRQ